MHELENRLIEAIIEYGIIEEKDREIYTIAITSLLFSLLTWGTLILLSVIFGKTFDCVIFLLYYIPLRIYAGGFHQKTRGRCYIQSLIIFLILLIGSKTWIEKFLIDYWIVFLAISGVIIWYVAPLETINKPLNLAERYHHKELARFIFFIEIIVLIILKFNVDDYNIYFSVMSIVFVTIHLILGILDNKLAYNR